MFVFCILLFILIILHSENTKEKRRYEMKLRELTLKERYLDVFNECYAQGEIPYEEFEKRIISVT